MQKVIVSCFCQTWGWSSHCLRGVTQTHLQSRKRNAWLDRLGRPSVTCEGEQVFLKGFWWTLVLQWWMDMRSIHTLSERLKHYTIETNDFVANVKCYCVLYTLFLSCRLGVHCDWNHADCTVKKRESCRATVSDLRSHDVVYIPLKITTCPFLSINLRVFTMPCFRNSCTCTFTASMGRMWSVILSLNCRCDKDASSCVGFQGVGNREWKNG